ncbi:Hypothetical_protein [Hexamita inflata]|uniref:Hypothetical_protein n=1 Tax=Hexamita inflata TaxID=28002 RepID=A0AA86UGX5_9EUKA|nr:Hypothetical protein HINF_LOCUS38327 [Hexamita inflata]
MLVAITFCETIQYFEQLSNQFKPLNIVNNVKSMASTGMSLYQVNDSGLYVSQIQVNSVPIKLNVNGAQNLTSFKDDVYLLKNDKSMWVAQNLSFKKYTDLPAGIQQVDYLAGNQFKQILISQNRIFGRGALDGSLIQQYGWNEIDIEPEHLIRVDLQNNVVSFIFPDRVLIFNRNWDLCVDRNQPLSNIQLLHTNRFNGLFISQFTLFQCKGFNKPQIASTNVKSVLEGPDDKIFIVKLNGQVFKGTSEVGRAEYGAELTLVGKTVLLLKRGD